MRLQALEGWRGVTALAVVLFHLYVFHSLFLQEWLRWLAPTLEFFFLISGFVMALGFSEKVTDTRSFAVYAVRRVGRVMPLHLAMLGLLLLIPMARFVLQTPGDLFSGKLSLDSLFEHILLIQTWRPEIALDWNHPAWTLPGEVFAYLLMAIVVWIGREEPVRWVLGGLIIVVAGYFFLQAMEMSAHYNVVSISRALLGFFCGFLLFHFWRRFPLKSKRVATVLEGLSAAAFIGLLYWHPTGLWYFSCHIVFAVLIYAYAHDMGWFSRLLSAKPLLWLGKHSFSMYMFHGVVTTWLMLIVHALEVRLGRPLTANVPAPGADLVHVVMLPQQWMNDALTLGYLGVVLVGAKIVFVTIEDPTRVYFSKLGGRIAKGGSAALAGGRMQTAGTPGQQQR